MNKACRKLSFCVLCALLLLPSLAQAKEGEVAFGRWWHRPALAKALELEPATVAALDELYLERKSRLIDLKAELQKERTTLKVLLDRLDLEREDVMEQYESISTWRAKLGRERMEYFMDVREIIGPERFVWLKNYYQQRRERLREMYREERERLDAQESAPATGQ